MPEQTRSEQVYDALSRYVRSRPDIGWGKALRDVALEPGNPFNVDAARGPRRWFVLFALVSILSFACFN